LNNEIIDAINVSTFLFRSRF